VLKVKSEHVLCFMLLGLRFGKFRDRDLVLVLVPGTRYLHIQKNLEVVQN
jgi:hypothetical protein